MTAAELAKRAVREARQPTLGWQFASAGTHVDTGNRLPRNVARQMERLGIPLNDAPTPLSERLVRDADLVLTAERTHRSTVITRYPFAVRKTFTILQFTRLLSIGRRARPGLKVSNVDDLFEIVRIGQTQGHLADDDSVDIADPVVSRSAARMNTCAEAIRAAVDILVFDGRQEALGSGSPPR